MGRRRRGQRDEPVIPTDSFCDIAFLLIIYFILAASISRDWGFNTNIPAGQKATEATNEKSVLLRNDGLFWGERNVTVAQLRQALAGLNLSGKDPNSRVVQFEAKGNVPWQDYYEVLAAIQQAGGVPGILMEAGGKK